MLRTPYASDEEPADAGGVDTRPASAAEQPGQTPEPELWQAWQERQDPQAKAELLARHLPYASTVAAMLYRQRVADDVAFDDYLQMARVGLLEAFERYRPDGGAGFRTFAAHRIRGAVLDGLPQHAERYQQAQWAKRLAQERLASLRQVDSAPDTPAAAPLAEAAALPDVLRQLADVGLGLALGYLLEGTGMVDSETSQWTQFHAPAYAPLALKQRQQQLHQLVRELPDMERRIIHGHYLQRQAFDEIARQNGLSKGRISQLHHQALARLREKFQYHQIDNAEF